MLAEFKTLYDIHRWLRYITWLGLLSSTLFLLYIEGGFPPHAWLILLPSIHALFSSGHHTDEAAPALILETLLLSLLWLGCWIILLWSTILLGLHYRWRLRELARQRQGIWMPSPQLSLAVSAPGGQAVMENVIVKVPRLRLPQRSPSNPPGAKPWVARAQVQVEEPTTILTLEDQPTRPERPSRRTTLPFECRVQPLRIGVGWNVGLARRHEPNEDSLVVLQGTCTYEGKLLPYGLFVIADGMGGHEDGQVASRIAMQSMMHTVLQNIVMGSEFSDAFFSDMLIGGVEWANLAIFQRGKTEGIDMGTTLTAALVIDMKAYIVNVGDSRTYLYRDSVGLIQVTHDHSLVASLVAFGQITPDEVYTHPDRNKVYRSLGQFEELKVDLFMLDLQPHDCLFLCSDGLWEMVRDPTIERIIRGVDDPNVVSDRLVQAALRGGGVDNISAIVVRVPSPS